MSNTVVTEEMISAVAWSPSHQEGVPWGMLLNDEQIGNILNIGLANAPPIDVDALAQEIRRVDGNHDKGAGVLAEALMPFLSAALQSAADTPPSEKLKLAERLADQVDHCLLGYAISRQNGVSIEDAMLNLRVACNEFRAAPLPPSKVREE